MFHVTTHVAMQENLEETPADDVQMENDIPDFDLKSVMKKSWVAI
jgi:hypothetical protein